MIRSKQASKAKFIHRYPAWSGTLVRDECAAYDSVIAARSPRVAAGCLAHARRHLHELARSGTSEVAIEALRRIAVIYRAEREFAALDGQERLHMRQAITQALWEELHVLLQFEQSRVTELQMRVSILNQFTQSSTLQTLQVT